MRALSVREGEGPVLLVRGGCLPLPLGSFSASQPTQLGRGGGEGGVGGTYRSIASLLIVGAGGGGGSTGSGRSTLL